MVELLPVDTEAQKRLFYRFASKVHAGNRNWIPTVWPQCKAYLDKRAPFFRHGDGDFWLATDGDGVVGTVGAAIDHARNRHLGRNAAVFGFFEVLADGYEVAASLWDRVREWARERGMTEIVGPRSFGPYEGRGFLVEGFDRRPGSLLGYSPPYYHEFALRYGWEVWAESVAYRVELEPFRKDPGAVPRSAILAAERARRQYGRGFVRSARVADWANEIARFHEIYNLAQSTIEDFAPMPLEEFRHLADTLRPIVDPDLMLIAEFQGRPIGLVIAYPDLAEIIQRARGLRHLWDYLRLVFAKRRAKGACLKVLGVHPEYRRRGVDAALYVELLERVLRKGYEWMELSLADVKNTNIAGVASKFGARVYQRYVDYRIGV